MPASSEVVLTVDAPVEQLGATNEKLTVDVPDGFRVLSCEPVEGFECSHAPAAGPKRTVVTWQRAAPAQPVPLTTDQFPFRMRTTDRPGKYTFTVSQFHSDGTSARAEPVLQVTPITEPPLVITRTPPPAPPAVRTQSVSETPGGAPAAIPVLEPEWARDVDPGSRSEMAVEEMGARTARGPLMVLAGFVAAVAAGLVYWLRRRVDADV